MKDHIQAIIAGIAALLAGLGTLYLAHQQQINGTLQTLVLVGSLVTIWYGLWRARK